jgi:hypothetical protein
MYSLVNSWQSLCPDDEVVRVCFEGYRETPGVELAMSMLKGLLGAISDQ